MASFFGKKGPTAAELKIETQIKKNITREFSQALKTLQREHINSTEPIFSDDLTNSVCNVLEAVFLHGLKGSTAKKLTSYIVGGITESADLSFWQVVKRFTHSDVVSQLNHLGQITTEIGMCRAWVRLALNEFLMESYVDAMIVDKTTMKYYYKSTAYLRDMEEPSILKSYIQGLAEFQFQLSYNSSVLNLWTTGPLILSGIWEAQPTPKALISPVTDCRSVDYSEPAISEQSRSEATQQTSPVVARSKARSTSGEKSKKRPTSHDNYPSGHTPDPPPNTPHDVSMLVNRAAEEVRSKLMVLGSSPNQSEASTSSHISCPDPSNISITEANHPELSDRADVQIQMSDNRNVAGELSKADTGVSIGGPDLDRRKSLPLEPTLTEALATTVETFKPTQATRPLTLLNVTGRTERTNSIRSDYDPMTGEESESRRVSVDVLSDNGSEPNYRARLTEDTVDNPGVGNSLGNMSGWSSSFDTDHQSRGNKTPSTAHTNPLPIDQRERVQSYGTLLQNYTPSSGGVTSPSIREVLQTLQEPETISGVEPVQHQSMDMESPSCSEYEIISTPRGSDMLYTSSKMYESQIALIGEICNEKGLDVQNYQCKGCARPVGLIYGSPRVCCFDGGYYCYECHENNEYYIPSRIVINWDFRKHKVAKKNFDFLQEIEDHPLLDLEMLNLKLYDHVNEMNDVKSLREQLCYVKSYLFTCKQSVAEDLRKRIWPKEYLYDRLHLYSLNDLLQVMSGQLANTLKKLVKFATSHIYECRLCSQKGFICEICNSPQVIYPFETDITERCELCKTVYHRSCKQERKKCPKCQRRMQRRSKVGGDIISPESDYANHPDDLFKELVG